MIPTREQIQPYIDKGLISVQKHPTEDLFIFNYTHACQYSQAWDDVTEQCRGLILDGAGSCVARPFRKFYNMEEHVEKGRKMPEGKPKIYDKMDGSLGVMYWASGKPSIATRGSFTSDQAVKANEMLLKKIGEMGDDAGFLEELKDKTLLWEILFPANQIVVNYGDREDLVFLGAIDIATGKDETEEAREALKEWFIVAEEFKDQGDISKLTEVERENAEGFVLVWPDGFKLKCKYENYVRLHRILTGLNEKRVWELLKEGTDIKEYVKHVPEEFEKWILGVADDIHGHRDEIIEAVNFAMDLWRYDKMPRKDAAIHIVANYPEIKGIIFTRLDGRNPDEATWKMVKPKTANVFKKDIDA